MAKPSDSSSEEDESMLQEAIDPSMFNTAGTAKDASNVKEKNMITNYKNNILRVTPEFQNFVAKRLSHILDKSIKEYTSDISQEEPDLSGGVKLFHSSQRILTDRRFSDQLSAFKNCQGSSKKKKKKRSIEDQSESESELFEKARSAAVSPEWILNKEGIAGWSEPKGKEIRVKKKPNGAMEIVNPPFISAPFLST